MTAKALFRVLSGLHEGAQIELTPGVWVVGADDSCDIILGDGLAARHATVTVGDDGQVRIAPLDAPVLDLLGNPRDGEALPAGEIVRLAEVGLAWGPAEAGADFWQGVAGAWARRGAAPQAQAGASADSADSGDAVDSAGPASGEKPQAAGPAKVESADGLPVKPEEKAEPQRSGSRKKSPMVIAAGIGLLAGCLAVALVPGGRSAAKKTMTSLAASSVAAASAPASASASASTQVTDGKPLTLQALGTRLRDLGLSGISVKRLPNGTYVFSGTVEDDAERALLTSEAKRLDGPAVLQLEVVSDRTAPVKAAFNALDLWPEVRWEPGADGSRGTVLVAGYMATSAVEEKAFDEVSALFSQNRKASDVPALERRILHREDLKALLTEALDREQLEKVGVEWLDGRIRLTSVLTAESRERLDRALAEVRGNSPVPLVIDIVNKEPPAGPEAKSAPAAAPAPAPEPAKPVFKVTAVSGGALKFVTLSDGSKCFEGGEMPGGFTLESISYNRLVLSKDKKRIIYPLKVTE